MRRRAPLYDLHTHFIPDTVLERLKKLSDIQAEFRRIPGKDDPFLIVNGTWGFELKRAFYDPKIYLKEQARAGIAHSLISPVPQLFLYESSAETAEEWSREYNHALADLARTNPDRISALGTVPLQQPARAAQVLAEAMDIGLKGVIIATTVNGQLLSDERFRPFWEEADRRKAIVFLHPLLCGDPRLRQRKMANLIGVPWETTVCATDLILSGTVHRYPDTRMLLAHGAGFLPYQIGRIQKGYEQWLDVSADLKESPEASLRRFWYDSVLWHPASLALLRNVAGTDRIVPGSDFPFDLSSRPLGEEWDAGAKRLLDW
ncbi:amidohydrolase [Kyrpidia spormannii]|uniref:Amidohydrolase n=1 Tax=Kyrpidia spormannii TaxID=2055160 RepID=A0A2K8N7Y4_9BACL|nr:amidohydrolase [Kyrpidia spormannii]